MKGLTVPPGRESKERCVFPSRVMLFHFRKELNTVLIMCENKVRSEKSVLQWSSKGSLNNDRFFVHI